MTAAHELVRLMSTYFFMRRGLGPPNGLEWRTWCEGEALCKCQCESASCSTELLAAQWSKILHR